MIRPLYLDAALAWQVRLDDGPALHVSAPGRSRSLYPLQRLARVISPSHAQWQTPALVACLRAGVPVLFHDAGGDPVGWCFGPRKRETTLANLLREAIGLPQGGEWMEAWRCAAERREILAVLDDLAPACRQFDPAGARAHLCNLHRQRTGLASAVWLDALSCANAALVAQRLSGMIGDPSLIGFAREGLHLGQTIAGLMSWHLHRLLAGMPIQRMKSGSPARLAAEAVEREGAALHRACGELIGSLEHHLRERLT